MPVSRTRQILYGLLTLLIITLLVIAYTDYQIQQSIAEKRFIAPTQYFSSPAKYYVGQVHKRPTLEKNFNEQNYRSRPFGSSIQEGDFAFGTQKECREIFKEQEDLFSCLFFRPRFSKQLFLLAFNELDEILEIRQGEDLRPVLMAQGEADIFAQYLGDKPTQQRAVNLGDIPRYCLDAVIAIEDPDFLNHQGISVRGIFRAMFANLRSVRWSQGGSTITQQLVKNYFLTPEKTITRKIKEILISLIFEFRVSKDDILETYLNVIYLGQSGVFEVRGYASAADFYFQKPLEDLGLSECALLAAIVNSPGRYNPVRKPEKAKARRTRVLSKMIEQQMISPIEKEDAEAKPLPKRTRAALSSSAPYYVDAVNKKLKELGIKDRSGLNVYTALDPRAQRLAQKAVTAGIKYFEKNHPHIKKLKTEEEKNLQAALVASNPLTGEVVAIVGGRSFATSPFNRAIDGARQVGSVFKPLVYLTALQNEQRGGTAYNPLTPLNNGPFKHEYDGQVWEPQNYNKEFSTPLPLFFALKESKNVPTARLAIDVGLENVIQTAKDLGVTSTLKPFPSLSLGAFEIKPLEVLKIYNSFSQMGEKRNLQIVRLVTDRRDEVLYYDDSLPTEAEDAASFAVLTGMLKETLNTGTGRYSRTMGFTRQAAGKTGTTSDTRDAWFAGFTPFHTAVVWVGYDDGTPHTLTGAGGALPIWTNYMRKVTKPEANRDFSWPENVYSETFSDFELEERGVPAEKAVETELYFRKAE